MRALLDAHGRPYAAQAGIRLKETPQLLYRLLVLACLLSARIRAGIAVAAAKELTAAAMRVPRRMAYGGTATIRRLLQEFPKLGPADADIFLREV